MNLTWLRDTATADQLRKERSWRQAGLAAGAIDPKQMTKISEDVRMIDRELNRRGERSW